MAHDITTHTDKRGHSFTATYNSDNSVASETDACSNTTSYSYTSSQVIITDPNSHTVKHNYTSGRLTSDNDWPDGYLPQHETQTKKGTS